MRELWDAAADLVADAIEGLRVLVRYVATALLLLLLLPELHAMGQQDRTAQPPSGPPN